jgi:hypothetical protein
MNYKKLGAIVMMLCIMLLLHVIIWRISIDILHIQISLLEIIFINILLELFGKGYRFISRKVLELF